METKYIYGILGLALIAVLGLSLVSAFGFGGKGIFNQNLSDEEKAEMQADRDTMQTAIENGDYEAWRALHEDMLSKMQAQLTEENFEQLREQHQQMTEFREAMQEAHDSGDWTKVQELKEEYGFEGFRGKGPGMGHFNGGCPFAE